MWLKRDLKKPSFSRKTGPIGGEERGRLKRKSNLVDELMPGERESEGEERRT